MQRHEQACKTVFEACKAAGVPCGIFTMSAEAAAKRRAEGYALVTVADDIGVTSRGFKAAMAKFQDSAAAPAHNAVQRESGMSKELLAQFASALADGSVRVVDLTQTLKASTPVIQLPPPFAPSDPFRMSEISHYDERGPGWYWNNLSMGEHTGTHFDAPCHWVTGKDNAHGYTDTIPVQRLVAPAVVIDCSKEAAADEKFMLEPAHIAAWEGKHGRIPKGAWVLMRTDWSKRDDPARFLNMKEDGPHSPGPSAATIKFLIEQRDVNGWGVEAVGTDHGQAFAFEPAFPAHHLMHGANKFGLASLYQSRPAAADRRAADHAAAQDREGLGQPAARAGAGAGVDLQLALTLRGEPRLRRVSKLASDAHSEPLAILRDARFQGEARRAPQR